jgi:hypothetical protein
MIEFPAPGIIMKLTLKTLSPILVLAVFVLGCSYFNQVKKQIEKVQEPQIMTATDGKSQLSVPGTWSAQKDLNDNASIQAGNLLAEQYAIVISESKEDFSSKMTLNDYADVIRKSAKTTLTDAVLTETKPVTINGYPAVQFEVDGTVSNIKAKWLYTLVDAPKNFHQILAWSTASKYEKNKPVFLEVVNSFKEIEGTTGTAPPAASPGNKK